MDDFQFIRFFQELGATAVRNAETVFRKNQTRDISGSTDILTAFDMKDRQLRVRLMPNNTDKAASANLSLSKINNVRFCIYASNSQHSNLIAAIANNFIVLPYCAHLNYVSKLIAHAKKNNFELLVSSNNRQLRVYLNAVLLNILSLPKRRG